MTENAVVNVGNVRFGQNLPFSLIAGPCQMESRDHAMMLAERLAEMCGRLDIGLVFKASYDKANRTSLNAERGLGVEGAMPVFDEIKSTFGIPCITDVHDAGQCAIVAEHVDVLQIPAFLCRQTDLLVAAAQTGKAINVKKGQFLAPWDMQNVLDKLNASGAQGRVMLCERGASFGYNTLVSDMRSLPTMAAMGAPVVFDATHSVQQPGGKGGSSGGQREFVSVLARAAVAVGVAGLFIETHDDPDNAPSDGPNMIQIDQLETLLARLQQIDAVIKD